MYSGVFFDITHLIKVRERIQPFIKKVCPIAPKNSQNLIFIVLRRNVFEEMEKIPKGDKRLDFINSRGFLDSVVYSLCCSYNDETKIVDSSGCTERYLPEFIEAMNLYFDESFRAVSQHRAGIEDIGFVFPFVCNGSSICLYRPNKYVDIDTKSVKRDIRYVLTHQQSDVCTLTLKIDRETFKFLQFITKAGVKGNKQREIFGSMIIKSNEDENGRIVYTLGLDKSRDLVYGEGESVNAQPTLYTFHSHPYQAYVNNKAKFGIPSVSDYIAMYTMYELGMILHFVAALEGLYVIHVDPRTEILKMSKEEILKYIKKKMKYDRSSIKNIQDYIDHVNGESNLFKLELVLWNSQTPKVSVSFNKRDNNCAIR